MESLRKRASRRAKTAARMKKAPVTVTGALSLYISRNVRHSAAPARSGQREWYQFHVRRARREAARYCTVAAASGAADTAHSRPNS
ncbi:hypothetical protein JCM16814_15790 [Desulfobaculum senezii]